MSVLNTKPIDINKFWEKTPNPLKYLLLIAIIIGCLYFLLLRRIDNNQIKDLEKIEQSLSKANEIVEKFEQFQLLQEDYNDRYSEDLRNLYFLVNELHVDIDKRIVYNIKNSNKSSQERLERMIEMNEAFDKMLKAYKPHSLYPRLRGHRIEKNDSLENGKSY